MTPRAYLALLMLLGSACAGPPDGVVVLRFDSATHWAGAETLEPPIHLPTQPHASSRTTVRLSIPEGSLVDVDDAGRLIFPVGTVADRVEQVKVDGVWLVADVRGSQLTSDGESYHLLRPERPGPGAALVGFAWPRARPDLDAWAHDALASAMAADGVGLATAVSESRRAALARGLRARGNCASCHERSRSADLSSHAIVHRPTDTHGWYVPQSILSDSVPLERYRPDDENDGPFVHVSCRDGQPERVADRGGRLWRCANGTAPEARFDLAAALQAGDPHARRVCRSRRWIEAHANQRLKVAHAAAFAACHGTGGEDDDDTRADFVNRARARSL